MCSYHHPRAQNPNRYFPQCELETILLAECQCSVGMPNAIRLEPVIYWAFAQCQRRLGRVAATLRCWSRAMSTPAGKSPSRDNNSTAADHDGADATQLDSPPAQLRCCRGRRGDGSGNWRRQLTWADRLCGALPRQPTCDCGTWSYPDDPMEGLIRRANELSTCSRSRCKKTAKENR